MKLSDWAKKQGIAYLTAYRWFKDNRLPVNAYQSDSGTIIVEDDSDILEQPMVSNNSSASDVMSLFLKKTVEFSKNNSSIEDFAAYILSNFILKINSVSESPKYSKNKPKSEDIQKHFQKFIKPKGEKPKVNMFVPDAYDQLVVNVDELMPQELVKEINKCGADDSNDVSSSAIPELSDFYNFQIYDSIGAEGSVSRTVDLNSTPQQINYTNSTNLPFGSSLYSNVSANTLTNSFTPSTTEQVNNTTFKLTQKELASAKVLESVPHVSKQRGRKPSKNAKVKL